MTHVKERDNHTKEKADKINLFNCFVTFSDILNMRELSSQVFQSFALGRSHHTDDDLLRHGWSLTLLPAKIAYPPTVLPFPILIKRTYVLVLLLFFFCLNSSFQCSDPIHCSGMSLDSNSLKTFYYGIWTQIDV